MNTILQSTNPIQAASTSYGGENVHGFRVLRVEVADRARVDTDSPPRSLVEANRWLLKNAAQVDAHARASTKRLTGRESL